VTDPETKIEMVNSKIIELDKQIDGLLFERRKFIECKNELALQIEPVYAELSETHQEVAEPLQTDGMLWKYQRTSQLQLPAEVKFKTFTPRTWLMDE
jgi:hypothetical protein